MPGITNVGALVAVVMDTRLSRKEQQHDPDVSVVSKQQTFGFLLFVCRQLGVSHRRQQQAACFPCVCVFLLQLAGVSKASSSSSAAVGSSAARCRQPGQTKRWRRRAGMDLSEQIDF